MKSDKETEIIKLPVFVEPVTLVGDNGLLAFYGHILSRVITDDKEVIELWARYADQNGNKERRFVLFHKGQLTMYSEDRMKNADLTREQRKELNDNMLFKNVNWWLYGTLQQPTPVDMADLPQPEAYETDFDDTVRVNWNRIKKIVGDIHYLKLNKNDESEEIKEFVVRNDFGRDLKFIGKILSHIEHGDSSHLTLYKTKSGKYILTQCYEPSLVRSTVFESITLLMDHLGHSQEEKALLKSAGIDMVQIVD